MNYIEFYNLLEKNNFLSPIWGDVSKMVYGELGSIDNKDEILKLFLIYFSLINDGNTCMSLSKNIIDMKWQNKCDSAKIALESKKNYDEEEINKIISESKEAFNYLDLINDNLNIIGVDKLFVVKDAYLYARKYYEAVEGIKESIKELFIDFDNDNYIPYKEFVSNTFNLTKMQEEAVIRGYNKNLIITGGPGTGKTTSIFFLLLELMIANPDYDVYLAAPSGKAASRMKESILSRVSTLNEDTKIKYQSIIKKIEKLGEYTIHRLLGYDNSTNGFKYGKDLQFPKKSIFVIDEASMADVCIFNSLIQAIPSGARLFLLGDKNQLPSVDCGAVLSELLNIEYLKDNVVELDESKRFTTDSEIFILSAAINKGGILPVKEEDWKSYKDFVVKEVEEKKYPIYYYKDYCGDASDEDIIKLVITKWGERFYSLLENDATNLDPDDYDKLKKIYDFSNESKILCSENEGFRGTHYVNDLINNKFFSKSTGAFKPGQIVMITKNNKLLDLYNGESGIIVKFKNDNVLYFMIEKSSDKIDKEGKKDNYIFKIGKYMFYPMRLISINEIDYAFAITVHKSQGSDYPEILVILPRKKGHPLVTREIVYTAITRTKGNTYILSNQERLEESKNKLIIRDTNIK